MLIILDKSYLFFFPPDDRGSMLQISLKIFGGEGAAVVVGRSWMEEAEGLICAGASWVEGVEEWVWTAVCEVVVAVLLWVVAGNGVSESWD